MVAYIEKLQKEKSIKDLLEFSIINIDKPSGPTSFKVDTFIKKELVLKKTSHFGTLDPMVTGILPVALNRACKLMPYFIGKNKTYIGIMKVHKVVLKETLQKKIKKFIGTITQMPPVKSRVKRKERKRTVYSFTILEVCGRDVLFKTELEAGTYVRKLVHDFGEKIGGAHMLELRRIQASIFKEPGIRLPEFMDAVNEYKNGDEKKLRSILIPGEIISEIIRDVQIKPLYEKKLYQGYNLTQDQLTKKIPFIEGEKITAFKNKRFIGVYEVINSNTAKPQYVLQPIKNGYGDKKLLAM